MKTAPVRAAVLLVAALAACAVRQPESVPASPPPAQADAPPVAAATGAPMAVAVATVAATPAMAGAAPPSTVTAVSATPAVEAAPQRPALVPAAGPVATALAGPAAPPSPAPTFHDALTHGAPSAGAAGGSVAPTPPAEAGTSRTALTGCLVAADEADAARFPPPPVTRAAGPPPVAVKRVAGGALIEHTLTHACCLKATVTTRLVGQTATVLEQLTGNPCRCRCGSTLRTAVALPRGAWNVVVELEEGGARQRVFHQELRVP